MKSLRYGVPVIGFALLGHISPALAAPIGVQTVGAFSFSTTGNTPNTTQIPITPFTADVPGTLTAVKIYFQPTLPVFGGEARLLTDGDPVNFTNTGALTFSFTSSSGQLTTNPGNITLSPSSASVNTTATASGNFTGAPLGSIATNTPTLQSYFSSSPTVDNYFATYVGFSTPSGGSINNLGKFTGTGQYAATTLSGQFYIQYEYTKPVASTPGPLPLLGAGAAFAYSRQIRRKIKASA